MLTAKGYWFQQVIIYVRNIHDMATLAPANIHLPASAFVFN